MNNELKKLLHITKEELKHYFEVGIISNEEYNHLLKEKDNMSIDDLYEFLEIKLDKEFDTYKENLLQKTPEKILDKSYETAVKEEMKEGLKLMEFFPEELSAMLKTDNILDEFYHDWLDCDIQLNEVLDVSLEESVAMLTRYYDKTNLSKER